MSKINISYSLKDFMNFKDVNPYLPLNVKTMCNDMGGTLIIRDIILKEIGSVIDNFTCGKNPNDIVFKNSIIEYLNKINQKNYSVVVEQLKKLTFSKYEHFATFSLDILQRVMSDAIAIKGIEMPDGQKSLSELYADIVTEFSQFLINDNDKEIKFITIFMDLCHKYFNDFTDPIKPLDSNNQYRVDNYKGYMNFLGILFEKHILSHKIVYFCLNKIKNFMFTEQWGKLGQNECENTYEGYRRVLYKIVNIYLKNSQLNNDKSFIKSILEIHNEVKKQNEKLNKLRKFTMMAHKDLENKLEKILNS
jgi:hypothetical protein